MKVTQVTIRPNSPLGVQMVNNKLSELTVQFHIFKLIADLQWPKTLPIHTRPIHSVESITLLRLKDS